MQPNNQHPLQDAGWRCDMSKKKDLEARIAVLEAMAEAVTYMEQRLRRAEQHLRLLDKETSAPMREEWRHVEVPHTDTTGCNCKACRGRQWR